MSLKPRIITGLPAAVKARPRADFRPNEFDQAITTKGYRVWWSRAAICPCINNAQTEQADINCPLCHGQSYYYFHPDPAIAAGAAVDAVGNVAETNEAGDGVGIYVLMTSLTQDVQLFEKFGEWVFGAGKATTQYQNKLGYRDRLVHRDSEMSWSQIINYDGSTSITVKGSKDRSGLRYGLVTVNQLRSIDTVYREEEDFILGSGGELVWLTGKAPDSGTRLTVHGTIRPTWIVMDHVNTIRDTPLEGPSPSPSSQTYRKLPIQVVTKLDYLVIGDD